MEKAESRNKLTSVHMKYGSLCLCSLPHSTNYFYVLQYGRYQYNTIQYMQCNAMQYNKCSSAQSTITWPTVHYNVSEYVDEQL